MSYEVQDFAKQVIERSREVPVLVDFWAPWCGPCRTLGPVLERLAAQANGRWELVKVNTEEHQDLAMEYKIASIPAVKLFVNGGVADEFVGALPEREIGRFLDRALPSPNAGKIEEAQRLVSEGAQAEAAAILEPLLAAEPGNPHARVLLAQAVLGSAPERVANLLALVDADSELGEKAEALRTLAGLTTQAKQPAVLPAAPVRERYLEGATALANGDFAVALEAFVDVVGRNRNYNDGAAKEACKAIFKLLGMRHPLTERFLRAFSSALHA